MWKSRYSTPFHRNGKGQASSGSGGLSDKDVQQARLCVTDRVGEQLKRQQWLLAKVVTWALFCSAVFIVNKDSKLLPGQIAGPCVSAEGVGR